MRLRIGHGFDVHAFAAPEDGRPLMLGGVSVPDDVVIRVAAGVEGAAALARAETFAGRLSQMAARAATL